MARARSSLRSAYRSLRRTYNEASGSNHLLMIVVFVFAVLMLLYVLKRLKGAFGGGRHHHRDFRAFV